MIENILLVLFYGVFLAAVLQVGKWFVRWLNIGGQNPVETKVFQFAFGCIFYSYVFHLLGMTHLLYGWLLLGFYVVPALPTFLRFLQKLRQWWQGRKKWRVKKVRAQVLQAYQLLARAEILLPILVLALIFFPLVPYLFLYPASWDVVAYHLPLPKLYLNMHFFGFAKWFDQIGFPIGIETLFGLGEVVREPRLSHFIHFSFIVALIAYLSTGVKYLFNRSTRWFATFLFLFQPMLFSEAALSAFVDYPFAFFCVVTAMMLVRFYQTKKAGAFIALSILVIFLPLIKISGLLVVAVVGVMLGWLFLREVIFRKSLGYFKKFKRSTWVLALSSLIFPIYWFLRTAYYTGNPFYPFYNNIFKGMGYVAGGKDVLKNDVLLNSFLISMLKNFYRNRDVAQDYVNLSAVLFLAIGGIACLLFFRSKRKELAVLATFSGLLLILQMFTIGPITRYVFFIFPMLALLMSAGVFEWLDLKKKKWFWPKATLHVGFSLLVLVLTFVLIDSTFYTRQTIFLNVPKLQWLSFFIPAEQKKLLARQDNYNIQVYANTHLNPKTDKVLQLLDNRIYYLDVPHAFANTTPWGYFNNKDTRDVTEAWQNIKSDGYTHAIKLNAWGAHPTMRQEIFNGFVESYLTPIATESGVTLYQIK